MEAGVLKKEAPVSTMNGRAVRSRVEAVSAVAAMTDGAAGAAVMAEASEWAVRGIVTEDVAPVAS